MATGVYTIHCTANNTYYVGETINSTERLRQHIKKLKAGRHENRRLQNTWNRYGHSTFTLKMVWKCPYEAELLLTRADLTRLTRRMEATIGGAMLEHGFDLMNAKPFDHWDDANPMTNPEVRKLGSVAALRRWADPDTRDRLISGMRESLKRPEVIASRKAGQLARNELETDRAMRSAIAANAWADPEKRRRITDGIRNSGVHKRMSKPVRCIETGEIFESGAAASRSLGKRITAISVALWTGKRCGGFSWERVQDNTTSE